MGHQLTLNRSDLHCTGGFLPGSENAHSSTLSDSFLACVFIYSAHKQISVELNRCLQLENMLEIAGPRRNEEQDGSSGCRLSRAGVPNPSRGSFARWMALIPANGINHWLG